MVLVKDKIYRQKVDSQQGYEDWEYVGEVKETSSGELWYVFKNDLGYYHFDEKDLKDFTELKM